MIDRNNIPPPGFAPTDPADKSLDSIAFALDRVRVYLIWIEEHRASFEADRHTDPENAERELGFLQHSTASAREYMGRLLELLLAGYSIDFSKRLPKEMTQPGPPRH